MKGGTAASEGRAVRIAAPGGFSLAAVVVGAALALPFLIGAALNLAGSQYIAAVGALAIGCVVGLPWLALPRPFAEATPEGMRVRRYGPTSFHPWSEVDRIFVQQGESELNLYLLTTTDELTPVPLHLRFVSRSRRSQQVGEFLDSAERLRIAGPQADPPSRGVPSTETERIVLKAPLWHRMLAFGWAGFALFVAGIYLIPAQRTPVHVGLAAVCVVLAVVFSVRVTRARVEVTAEGVRTTDLRAELVPWSEVGRAVIFRKSGGVRLALLHPDNRIQRLDLAVKLPIQYSKVRQAADAINRYRRPPAA